MWRKEFEAETIPTIVSTAVERVNVRTVRFNFAIAGSCTFPKSFRSMTRLGAHAGAGEACLALCHEISVADGELNIHPHAEASIGHVNDVMLVV